MRDGDKVPIILYLGPAQWRAMSCFMSRSIFSQRKETLVEQDYSHKVPSFCMTTFSASLTNLTVLLPQSHDLSYYVSRRPQSHDLSYYISRRILARPPLWLRKHTGLRAHDFAHPPPPNLWQQPRLANVTCAWSWKLHGINSWIPTEVEAGCATELVRNRGKENSFLTRRDIRLPPRCNWGLRSSGFVRSVDR
jgi:hypothetical protein